MNLAKVETKNAEKERDAIGGIMGKVLDLTARMKTKDNSVKSNTSNIAEILDMTQKRQEMITRERREVKRTILTEFVGAFVVLPNKGLLKVALYDISDGGVAFDLEMMDGRFQNGEEVAMRVYLNHTTYFPFIIKVSNSRVLREDGLIRHGANFVKGTINDVALHHFVKFIESVSASLKTDDGDIQVSNIS